MAKNDMLRLLTILTLLIAVGLTAAPQPETAVVRVTSTLQNFDFIRPWQKNAPGTRQGLGALIGRNRVLVTSGMVANATFIELERIDNNERSPASIDYVDYDSNLAVISADEEEFFAGGTPLPLADHALSGQTVHAWQFDDDGTPILSSGPIRNVDVSAYPLGDSLLQYAAEIPIPQLDGSYTFPIIRNDELVGMLISYRSATRVLQILPAPVIHHFLADMARAGTGGIPRAGFGFSQLDDEQLRNYVELPEGEEGVYISAVQRYSPAADADLKVGDVLLAIGGHAVNDKGEYEDPVYGDLPVAHLTKTRSHAGDVLDFHIFRDGERLTLPVTIRAIPAWMQPIPTYQIDSPPTYLITGGFIFQELSQQYLKEWGKDWPQKAPQRLVHLSRKQWDLLEPGERLVFLSAVLPAEPNTGYTHLQHEVVEKVNGKPVWDLISLAEALDEPVLGPDGKTRFLHIEFAYTEERVYLAADLVEPLNEFIQQRYRLPSLRRLDTTP